MQRFVNKERTVAPQEQAARRENKYPKPPLRDIRMIVGGTVASGSSKKAHKTYLKIVQNVQLTGFVPKIVRVDNPIIEFSKEDARHLHHPHDDALIVNI